MGIRRNKKRTGGGNRQKVDAIRNGGGKSKASGKIFIRASSTELKLGKY
jgi:hypothetical protein